MSNENWTYGEWRINQRPHGKVSIVAHDGHQVCLMWNCKERDANAGLIKAAPKLYAALRDLLDASEWPADYPERLKAAAAALAEARGEL